MKILTHCFLLLFAALRLWAQSPPVERIGIEQGLSQGYVMCLEQDREGFLWAGTTNGLNRYDGHRFKHFSTDPFNKHSLPSNHVKCIRDAGEYLLVGTDGDGMCIFHKKTERFFRIPAVEKKKTAGTLDTPFLFDSLPSTGVNEIVFDEKGTLWVQTHRPAWGINWLCRVHLPERFWERLPQEPGLISQLKFECWDAQSKLFLMKGKQRSLCRVFNEQMLVWRGKRWEPLQVPFALTAGNFDYVKSADSISEYWWTADGTIWRSGEAGMKWEKTGTMPNVKPLFYMDQKFAWVLMGDEGYTLENYPLRLSPFHIDWSAPIRIAEKKEERWDFITDHSGNLWHVNSVYGLLKTSPAYMRRFHTYSAGESIYSTVLPLPNGNALWLKGHSDPYFTKPVGEQEQRLLKAFWPENTYGIALQNDKEGRPWMLGIRGEKTVVVRADPLTGASKTWEMPFNYDGPTNFNFDPDDGSIWFVANEKLVRFTPDEGAGQWESHSYHHLPKGRQLPYCLAKTADGSWWVGTDGGIIRVWDFAHSPGQAKSAIFRNDPEQRNSLSNNAITSLLTDPHDRNLLWIGTRGGGLNRLDVRTMQFAHITKRNGLPDNVIYGILAETPPSGGQGGGAKGNLWVSTNRGIARYQPATGAIKSFRRADGLPDDEFNTWAYAKGQNGDLYFGGINGMCVFNPAALQENPNKPKVFITGLKVNNLTVEAGDSSGILAQSIEFCPKIDLPFSQNNVTLEFAALEFTASSKNRYRYWLEGMEKEGAHEGNEPHASYLNLPPGNFTFIVYGSNNDGLWSEQPARLQIRILPPWHRHPLAYLCYALALGGLLFWYRQLRENQRQLKLSLLMQEKEAGHLQEMNRLKLEEFTQRLLEKSQLIAELQAQQESENANENGNAHEHVTGETPLEKIHNSQILTRQDWENFRRLFEQVHPGFLAQLSEQFPQLTAAETRLVLLAKLNLSTHQSAAMLGVTSEAVKKTRQRLRKKLEINEVTFEKLLGKD